MSATSLGTRKLSLWGGIRTIVSLMIGAGIFSSAGRIFNYVGSPGMTLIIWVATGLLGLAGALCYAELGTMLPGSGGEHLYIRRAFGPMMAFLFDWTSIILLKPGTNAVFSVAFGEYFIRLVLESKLHTLFLNPETYADKEEELLGELDWYVKLAAICACLLCTMIVMLSTKWSDRFQSVLTFGKIAALATVVIGGIYQMIAKTEIVKNSLGKPFEGTSSKPGGYLKGFDHGLWAYEGWNNLNIVSGDLVNPTTNLPLSIWISVTSIIFLYILTIIGYFAVIRLPIIKNSKTIAMDFGRSLFGRPGGIVMPLFVISSVFGSTQSNMISTTEVVNAAVDEGHMPKLFGRRSPMFGTFIYSLLFQTFISCCFILAGSFDWLVFLYTFPQWFFYGTCIIALLKLRYTDPKMERPYRVWLTTPVLFLLSCLFLIGMSFYDEPWISLAAFGLIFSGAPVWFFFVKNAGPRAAFTDIKRIMSRTKKI